MLCIVTADTDVKQNIFFETSKDKVIYMDKQLSSGMQ